MSDACPIPTPAERQYLAVQDKAERTMLASIYRALEDAARQTAEELQASGYGGDPPAHGYFAAVAHQKLFVCLCGGDPETFEGGDPDVAARIIDNERMISEHYWANGDAEQSSNPSG
ncbi:MAG: hypothetical protein J7499_18495 [Sphingopyxis sp.]|nr:hypothetical protein [Sphingopyxis sp.]